MSFRGRGCGGGAFQRRGSARGGRGNGFNGGRGSFATGPPENVICLGHFVYPCLNDLVCKVSIDDVPYFNAPVYLENKEQIGKVDEIFGTVKDYLITVKLSDNMKASSFKTLEKIFIDPLKLLPLKRFLTQLPQIKGAKKKESSGTRGRFNKAGALGRFGKGDNGRRTTSRGFAKSGAGGGYNRNGSSGRGRRSGGGFRGL